MTLFEFWTWFLEAEKDFYQGFPQNRKQIEESIKERVNKINRHITFLVSYQKLDGKIAITFSPNGMKEAFMTVKMLVSNAPKELAPHWLIKKHFP